MPMVHTSIDAAAGAASNGTSVQDLTSGASGGSIGGLGYSMPDFATLTVDAGANWYIDGTDSDGVNDY